MIYDRTLPRDLFNEAKLLKCMGQLALLIHNGLKWPLKLSHNTDLTNGFDVRQDPGDGGLFTVNLVATLGGNLLTLRTCYNSKAPFPLVYLDETDGVGCAFEDDGTLSDEFCAYLDRLTEIAKGDHDPVC